MGQEPWDEPKILQTAKDKYDVKFPLTKKVDVNGKNAHKIFKYLRSNSELYRPIKGSAKEIPWNFTKFIVDGEGRVTKYVIPQLLAEEVEDDIRAVLGNPEAPVI
jgi:glutathione peroxidase